MRKKTIITRREVILTGLTALGGIILPGCSKKTPPTYGNILRIGDNFTYIAQRTLLPGQSMAKEYNHGDISSFPATGTTNPGDPGWKYYSEDWEKLHHDNFTSWGLKVEGRVVRPKSYSMAELQHFPARKQITRHTCEEGWTAIAEWNGVALSRVLQDAGIMPSARYVNFHSFDGLIDSIDMLDAFHPQTILAYGMNGKNLPIQHGAPLRVRIEKQIGYKSVKYLQKIVVTDEFVDPGDTGWSWYVGM